MNADEDDDTDGFTDNFLDMMGGGGGKRRRGPPASEKLTGDMADAFKALITEMQKKGDSPLVDHGKFKQTYGQAASFLKRTEDLEVKATNQALAQRLNKELTKIAGGAGTSSNLATAMPKIVDMASNALAQNAEFNKAKGPAFDLLVKQMKAKGNETLHTKDNKTQTYAKAAKELEEAQSGLDSTHDDPNLSQEINAKLAETVASETPPELKGEMKETVDLVSKYLSEKAVDESTRAAGGVVTDPGFYIDEHGVKRPFGPNDQATDFYIDENGVRRKLKPGEKTYVDAQGNIRKVKDGTGAMAAPLTAEGFYVDENGVTKKIDPNENPNDYYVDEKGIRRKKKPGEQTYVDAQGIVRKVQPGAAMAAPLTAEGFYVDENGVTKKIDPNENPNDYYVDEKGIRRKKKPGEQTYVDAQGIVRKVQPGAAMAAPLTAEGFYVDENGVTKKIDPNENPNDYYVDEKGIRRKKKPGEQTYVDAQGIVRKVQPGAAMAAPLTAEGFYVDENGVTKKIDPNENPNDYYVDEKGIRRKKKPGEQTYVDAQGIVRKVQTGAMAAPLTAEGFYVDENGVTKKIDPNENPNDYYVDEKGIRRKKKPGEQTYVDAQGIVRKVQPGAAMAAPLTAEGFYVDENGVTKKIDPNENPNDYYVDEKGIRRKKKPGEQTYVDAQGIVRKVQPGAAMAAPLTAEGFYVDENGVTKKIDPNENPNDYYVDEKGIRRKKKPGEQTYVDAQGIVRKVQPGAAMAAPGAAMAAPLTAEGFYVDENGVTKKIDPNENPNDYYVDEKGIRRKKKPGEQTYVDAQGIVRKVQPGAAMAAPLTAEGFYVDENGVTKKIDPNENPNDYYVDEKGIRRKKKPGEQTYVDAQGIVRKVQPGAAMAAPGAAMAAPLTAEGFYVDENGVTKKIDPNENPNDYYVDEKGIRRKKKPGEQTYVDAQGIVRKVQPRAMAAPLTAEGFYVDENGVTKKIDPNENPNDYYVDEKGIRRKKKPGEQTYVDAQGIVRKVQPGGPGADEYYIDAQGNRKKKSGGGDSDVDKDGVRRSRKGRDDAEATDPDYAAALGMLHGELRAKGAAPLYTQPHTDLTHAQASDWIKQRPKVDKAIKESGDTARLHKKFERKLSDLVSKKTPPHLQDAMQDVIIESARVVAENFVANNYKALVKDGLIAEMQKKGNEILVEVGGVPETFFQAAQRLKKASSLEAKEPCDRIERVLSRQLDDMVMRSRSMPRKVVATMKDHIKDAAEYLSEHVTKPDEEIEAYVALLNEMEARGDTLLFEGNIPKSYKSCAAYLRGLTSIEDRIKRPNSSLKSATESKLQSIMANVEPHGYKPAVLKKVISNSAGHLVSYIMLQGERTEALKVLTDKLADAGTAVLLRHGTIRKGHGDGAELLRGKNADQLNVTQADPVVARKIQIKLDNLMKETTPDKFKALMPDVIEDVTMYLANYLLQPRVIQVCKCMKNVFVQCELWCDEILRRVARPCCTCSRHVSAQAMADLTPPGGAPLRFAPGSTRAFLPGLEVEITPCPSRSRPCPAPHPAPGCNSYMVYSASTASYQRRYPASTSRLDSSSSATGSYVAMFSSYERQRLSKKRPDTPARSPERDDSVTEAVPRRESESGSEAVYSSGDGSAECEELYWRMPSTMFAAPSYSHGFPSADSCFASARPPLYRTPSFSRNSSFHQKPSFPPSASALLLTGSATRRQMSSISDFEAPAPTISTDQMSDWHAMMVSLMWNVQAWRDWIQENINRALSYQPDLSIPTDEADEQWASFQRRVSTEALQWRQYNLFSRQLTLRLALRYRDKRIVSPTKALNRTETYIECQREMLEIIEMFNRWTQWLSDIVKETNALTTEPDIDLPLNELRWQNFKMKIEECSTDWEKYNLHLKVCWEQKYQTLIAEWLPAWKQPGPVWVVSACGAVPSGAVAAGIYDSEVVWVARTTHRCNVLPGALHPSKHCCIVYADGAVHHYTKYQVLCNADTTWLPWRAGVAAPNAVRVAPGVHVGRVLYRGAHLVGAVHAPHYRCHVVIFGRPFAFNCYEILVLAEDK